MLALVQQHARESEIIVDRRDEPGAAILECWRPRPLAVLGGVEKIERGGLVVGEIACRKTIELLRRHEEAGVLHAERCKNALAQEFAEALRRCACEQDTENVGAWVVE